LVAISDHEHVIFNRLEVHKIILHAKINQQNIMIIFSVDIYVIKYYHRVVFSVGTTSVEICVTTIFDIIEN